MSERWTVEMIEAIRGDAGNTSSGSNSLMFAKIRTAQPITLLIHDQTISQSLYISASLSVQAGDEVLVLKSGVAFYILLKVVPI